MNETILGFLIAAVMIVSTIIKAKEARQKKEEERRKEAETKAIADAGAGRKSAPAPAQARVGGGRSLTQILEELAREASGGDSQFPSEGEFVGAEEHGTAEYLGTETPRGWQGGVYSVEDADAEARYVGGEMRPAARHLGGEMVPRRVMSVSARTESANRQTLGTATGSPFGSAAATGATATAGVSAASNSGSDRVRPTDGSADDPTQDDTAGRRLRELLDGGFDLRRAVIETEILTPKYIAKY